MKHTRIYWPDLQVAARLGSFVPDTGVAEFHIIIEPDTTLDGAEEQHRVLEEATRRLERLPEMKNATLVWKRFFVSDAPGQARYLGTDVAGAVSVVGQPPLSGAKVSVWLYFVEGVQVSGDADNASIAKRPHYTHIFHTQLHERAAVHAAASPSIGDQTSAIFDRYGRSLYGYGCTLEGNCIRTWIFVRDVDVRYAEMVVARRRHFEREGLTPQTHYIASTGIEGSYIYPDVLVLVDAYAIAGIAPGQIKYLQAPTHLNPTYEYGVTFERGTSVTYGDRRHIFISGTASIDNRGGIVHPSDIGKQTARAFENVGALLSEAGAKMDDVACMIVYVRDAADYAIADDYAESRYPDIPRLVVLAPVCRPGWLVEVECMATTPAENNGFAPF